MESQEQVTKARAPCIICSMYRKNELLIPTKVEAGAIASLIDALKRDDCPTLQYETLGLLNNIAFGAREHTVAVVNSGVIPKVIDFLAYEGDLAERAISILGSFSLQGSEARVAVLEHGAVTAMLPYLRTDTPVRRLRTCVRALSNLCSHNDYDDKTSLEWVLSALPCIHDILDIENEEFLDPDDKEIPFIACDILVDACTALTNIMHGPDKYIEAVQAVPGLTARLVALLEHEANAVTEAALNAVGNMLAGTGVQVDRCLNENCLDHIASLLQSSNSSLVREAARATSNIFAEARCQKQLTREIDLLTPLRNIMTDGDSECQKQAVYAVTYLCYNGSAAQHEQLVSRGVLPPYCALLTTSDLAGEVLDGLNQLIQAAERNGNVMPLCYLLDELDVLEHMQQLKKHVADEDQFCKIINMGLTLRKHARVERFTVYEETVYTIQKIVEDLESQDLVRQKPASRAVYDMLREQHPPINGLLEAGITPLLIKGLEFSDLHSMSAWALAFITKERKHRVMVLGKGTMQRLISLLVRGGQVAKLAAGTLGNIALHGPEVTDALHTYIKEAESALTELRTYTEGLKRLCSQILQESMLKFKRITLRALPFVKELLFVEDPQILEDGCGACASLMLDPDNYTIEAVQAVPGLTARLVALMRHGDIHVQEGALRAVVNMLARTDTQVDRCLNAGCLDHITPLLQSSTPALVELAVLAARNILSHTQFHIQQALEKDILIPLRNVLANGDVGCQYHAALAITNLSNKGSAEQRACVVSRGVLQPYCALLATPDRELARNVMGGLYAFIKEAMENNKAKTLCAELVKMGAFDHLQQFLELETDKDFRHNASVISRTLCQQAREDSVEYEDGKILTIEEIVKELKTQDLAAQIRGARAARNMLSNENAPRTEMMKAGVVAVLVAALDRRDCFDLQCLAAGALYFIVRGTHEHRGAVINGGAIPKLIALLSLGTESVVPAALALAFLSRRAPAARDLVLSHGAIQAIMPFLHQDTPLKLLRSCVGVYLEVTNVIVSTPMLELVLPAVPYVTELLDVEDCLVLEGACSALGNLLHDLGEAEAAKVAPELAPRLVALLSHEDSEVKEVALGAVANMLAVTGIPVSHYIDAGCLDHIVSLLYSEEASIVAEAARATANVFHLKHSYIQRTMEKDILTPLLSILTDAEPNSFIQYHTACAFANLTCGDREHQMAVVEGGAIPNLVALLSHEAAVAEPAALALGNIGGGESEAKYLVLAHGTVESILPHMQPNTPLNLLRRCVETYKNICAGIVSTSTLEFVSPGLPYISTLLEFKDPEVVRSACAALSNLMLGPAENAEAVQAVPGLTARLVALLGHEASEVRESALDAVTNMLRGTETQIDRCLDAGCLDYLVYLLRCREPTLVDKAVQAASNILRYSPLIHRALKADMLTPILNLIAEEMPYFSIKYHAVGALNNLTAAGTPELRMAVVNGGAIPKLVPLLAHEAAVAEVAAMVLGYIGSAGSETRDLVRAHGAVPAILQNMREDRPLKLWSSCVLAYRMLSSENDHDDEQAELLRRASPMLPRILELQDTGDEKDAKKSCGAIIIIMETPEGVEAVQAVPGLAARLVALLGHEAARVKRVAIIAVMLMLSGTDTQIECCFTANCVDYIVSFLECRDSFLMEEAAQATRTNLGETHPLLQRALEQDVLTPFMRLLDCHPDDKRRIAIAIGSLCRLASGSQRARLVSRGVLQPCCALLAAPERDVVAGTLDSLHVLLQVAKDDDNLKPFCSTLADMGVLHEMEKLKKSEDVELNEKARRLLHAYFPGESRPRPPTTAFSYILVLCFQLSYEIWNLF